MQDIRDNFLILCKQYNAMGQLFHAEADAWNKNLPALALESCRKNLDQYKEVGEQLKTLGHAIDAAIPGDSVLYGPNIREITDES